MILAVLATFMALLCGAFAYNNGLGLFPAMGWNTWCTIGPCFTDTCYEWELKDIATAMLVNGMHAAGYHYINLDDCWAALERTADGELQPDPKRFPSGIPYMTSWLHDRGFKFGLYTSAGSETCGSGGRPHRPPGSFGHYKQDAQTFAKWGVDYVKIDWCGGNLTNSTEQHTEFSRALNATGRPIWLELCRGYHRPAPRYVAQVANSWRISGDHHDNWKNTYNAIENAAFGTQWSGRYNWAYNDFLMTGGQGCYMNNSVHCPGMSDEEYRTSFAIWAITASPLIVATDVRNMTSIMNQVLLNMEAIAVNQENLNAAGTRVALFNCDTAVQDACQVWTRTLSDGSIAVVLYNAGESAHDISVNSTMLNSRWTDSTVLKPRDLWAHEDLSTFQKSWTAKAVPSHGNRFMRVSVYTPPHGVKGKR